MSVLNFDCRLNPGFTEKVHANVAIVMLKNIQAMKQQGLKIEDGITEPLLYAYKID